MTYSFGEKKNYIKKNFIRRFSCFKKRRISLTIKFSVYIVSLITLLLQEENNLMNNKIFSLYCFLNHSLNAGRDDFS